MSTSNDHRILKGVQGGGQYVTFAHPEDGSVVLTQEVATDAPPRGVDEDYTVQERVDQTVSLLAQYRNVLAWNEYHNSRGELGDTQYAVDLSAEMRMLTGVDIIEGDSRAYDAITAAARRASAAPDAASMAQWTAVAKQEATWMVARHDSHGVARYAAANIAKLEVLVAQTRGRSADAHAAEQHQPIDSTNPFALSGADQVDLEVRNLTWDENDQYATLMKATTVDTPASIAREAWTRALDQVGPYGRAKSEHERRNFGSSYGSDDWATDLRFACKAAEVRVEEERHGATIEDRKGLSEADFWDHARGTSTWDARQRPKD